MTWPMVELGELCNTVTKGTTPTSVGLEFSERGIPFLRIQDIDKTTINLKNCLFINKETHATLERSKIKSGDFLLTIAGTIGKVAIVPNDFPECNCNQAIAILRFDKDRLHPHFLKYWLATDSAINQITKKKVTATISNLSLGQIKQLKIPLPPLAEQKRIAAILDKADAIRQKRQQAITLADQFLRSVFLDMFGDPVTNPKGWPQVEISSVCSDIVDCVNRTAPSVDYPTPYKMVRTTNVKNREIDLSGVKFVDKDIYENWIRRLKPNRGDIIFTREAPAGEAGVVNTNDLIFLGQRTMHFRPNLLEAKPSYLLYELTSSGVQQQIVRCSAGSTVTHLSVPECKKFIIRKPSIALQEKFEKHYNISLNIKANARKALQLSEQVFFSLSQKAFSGQL